MKWQRRRNKAYKWTFRFLPPHILGYLEWQNKTQTLTLSSPKQLREIIFVFFFHLSRYNKRTNNYLFKMRAIKGETEQKLHFSWKKWINEIIKNDQYHRPLWNYWNCVLIKHWLYFEQILIDQFRVLMLGCPQ